MGSSLEFKRKSVYLKIFNVLTYQLKICKERKFSHNIPFTGLFSLRLSTVKKSSGTLVNNFCLEIKVKHYFMKLEIRQGCSKGKAELVLFL